MPIDDDLADRVRQCLGRRVAFVEKKMFGGVVMMVSGHMACGISRDRMLVRLPRDEFEAILTEPGVEPLVQGGRRLTGFAFVAAERVETRDAVELWVERALRLVLSLRPK